MAKPMHVSYHSRQGGLGAYGILRDLPEFVAKCIKATEALNDQVNSISLLFISEEGPVKAEIAWRNEVFAVLHPSDGFTYADRIFLSDPHREIYRDMMYTEEETRRELPQLLLIHLKTILRKHELRVRNARTTLDLLEPGHPPGLAQRQ